MIQRAITPIARRSIPILRLRTALAHPCTRSPRAMSSSAGPQSVAAPDANTKPTPVKFQLSDVAKHGKPLGEEKYIRCVCVVTRVFFAEVIDVDRVARPDA